MRVKLSVITAIIIVVSIFDFFILKDSSIESLRDQHKSHLVNSPFVKTDHLSKKERKSKGLPPNKYFERLWELTMNPETGKPEPRKALLLQNELHAKRKANRSPGDSETNPWIERGPNNIGGRTRVILFDPNDDSHKKVYAGGVSGGLWYNNDITDVSSSWFQVNGVPGNMNVSCITVDPRDSNVWYLGTGEQYTAGDVVGNGVYKTTDGGQNWTNVSLQAMGVGDLTGNSELLSGIYFVNDIIAWDNGTSTDVFVAVGGFIYNTASSPNNWLGLQSAGLYKSSDDGTSWVRIENSSMSFDFGDDIFYFTPNDLEISADNTLWLGMIGSPIDGNGSGFVFSSTNGTTWRKKTTLPNSDRVQLAVSKINPNSLYALTEGMDNVPHIYRTTDGFDSLEELSKPVDSDSGIPADDFTRGQAFYDLMIEVDPTNDATLYVGGIDLFRSSNSGNSWTQISKWNPSIEGNIGVVHADQHAMTFHPENNNQAVFGNDGGVYYCNSLSAANRSSKVFEMRNTNLNITQFYKAAIGPTSEDEYFLAGAQDNGTQFFSEPNPFSASESQDISGGDGGYCFVDQIGESYLIVSYVYNQATYLYNFELEAWRVVIRDNGDGDFINQSELDSNLDILYVNGTNRSSNSYRLYRLSNLNNIPESGSATKQIFSNSLLRSAPTALKVSPFQTKSTTLIVGTETGKLYKVTDANANAKWTDITGNQFLGSISDIEYGKNSDQIFVTFHNYGVKSIWFTNDGGATWKSKEGDFPDIPVKSILQNPIFTDEVVIGTELGVWKTKNFSADAPNWQQTYNGMSDVKVMDLQYRKDKHAIMAATYGRGLFSGVFDSEEPTLYLSVASETKQIAPNSSSAFSIDYEPISGFSSDVTFSIEDLPSGITATFEQNSTQTIADKGTVDILFTVAQDVPLGVYNLKLQAVFSVAADAPTGTQSLKSQDDSTKEIKTLSFQLFVIRDKDLDTILDVDDNCPDDANRDQLDTDNDSIGDACDDDDDNDGYLDVEDNCPLFNSQDQNDNDNDGEGDPCDDDDDNDGVLDINDNAPFDVNPDQKDTDNDGIGNVIDPDDDNDGIEDELDNCPFRANPLQIDSDEDGEGDVCELSVNYTMHIPKAFTPNGDGFNDTWTIKDLYKIYPENSLRIFNKSGKEVFYAVPFENNFNGLDKNGTGSKLPIGSYTFILNTGAPIFNYYPSSSVKKGWIYITY
jgi:gliding motility-associated-like protein